MQPGALLRLISEATRHAILEELRHGEASVAVLVESLAGEQSNVSHHLAVLRGAGLVASRREGRSQLYRLSDPEVANLLAQVEGLAARLDRVAYTAGLGIPVAPTFSGYG